MSNELKAVISQIDLAFIKYFEKDKDISTIFVVGSMAHDDYKDRLDNDYDIRVISNSVTSLKIKQFEEFLDSLSKKLTTETIAVDYSCLVGPVNHKISTSKKNVLIHGMIHEVSQMDSFLPVTHKYQYGQRYRIIYGNDSLKRFQDIVYTKDELINCHEGLKYCLDMLKKKEYRYLSWDVSSSKCEFNYHAVPMSEETVLENCFYSVNKFINNLINYCNFSNYDIPEDKMVFTIQLLGSENANSKMLYLLHGLFLKNEKIFTTMFQDPLQETINLLELLLIRMDKLEEIFPNKTTIKKHKLVKN